MFRILLLLFAVTGLSARPIHRLPNGRLKQTDPALVHDHTDDTSAGGKLTKHIPAPAEFCRQGTEPSRRFLMDGNTGKLTQDNGLDEFRQGTEQQLNVLQELRARHMMRSHDSERHQQRDVPAEVYRQGTEPSGHVLMDMNTGRLTEPRRAGSKWEVVSENEEKPISAPVESRRQGTEPSRRFLIDMNTGMLLHEVGEMNRRVSGFYNPSATEMRMGTQNSHVTLVDPRTGRPLPTLTELQRSTAPLEEFKQGTEYQPHILQELRLNEMHRRDTEPSRNLLTDLNPGLLTEGRTKWEVVSENEEKPISAPVESRRQGTEPSRRFLIDMNTGMLLHEVGEMNRRVSGFYNPSATEMRMGTQNSHVTLVDPRTGRPLPTLTELQRSTAPLEEFKQGTEYQPHILQELRLNEMHRRDTEPSRNLLTDLNPGLLTEGRTKWEVVSENEEKPISAPVESRRQGTEPSRRFLIDMNTGMLLHEVGEMNRRVSGFYNPSATEMRMGTQNSHVTLVDPRTGRPLPTLTELQRSTAPLEEFKQGTEYQPHILQELRLNEMHRQH